MIFVLLPFWTLTAGAHHGLDRAPAAAGSDQRIADCRRQFIGGTGDFSLMYNMFGTIHRDDAYPAAVHGAAALFGECARSRPPYMRAAKSLGATPFNGVPQGLSAPDPAGNRCRRGARLHHLDRLLHHPSPSSAPVGPDDLERDCATHAAITELGPRGRTRDDSCCSAVLVLLLGL